MVIGGMVIGSHSFRMLSVVSYRSLFVQERFLLNTERLSMVLRFGHVNDSFAAKPTTQSEANPITLSPTTEN